MFEFVKGPVRGRIRPAPALLSPAWLLALALLIANDHWFKGGGVLPEVVTGKLSDFAGMIVAPVLLAVALRVRSRRALAGCHVAVGLVFAAVQLSPVVAGAWSSMMGSIGYPWTITCDPTDLLALPFLLVSWALLVPHMDPDASPLIPAQRAAVAAVSVLGLWSSVATTEGEPWDPGEPFFLDVQGQLYLANANDIDMSFHVRYRREDVELDCAEVASDPGRLLSEVAFGEAQYWLLPPGATIGLEMEGGDCDAVWVAGEGIEPKILFIDDSYTSTWWPGRLDAVELDDLDNLGRGGVAIQFDEDGRGVWFGADEVLHTPRTDTPEQPASCELPAGESRIEWPEITPPRPAELLAIEAGLDGCFALELQELILNAGETQLFGSPYSWYLCAPDQAMPFVMGDIIGVAGESGSSGARELTLTLLDPMDLEAELDPNGTRLLEVRLLRGGNDPQFIGPAINRELEAAPGVGCPWQLEPGCANAERYVELRVVGGQGALQPGVAVGFADDPGPGAKVRTAILAYIRQRAVVDDACSDGATRLTHDIDIAVVNEPLL